MNIRNGLQCTYCNLAADCDGGKQVRHRCNDTIGRREVRLTPLRAAVGSVMAAAVSFVQLHGANAGGWR